MKTAILFGGSGYIGQFLLRELMSKNEFEQFFVLDIREFPQKDFLKSSKKLHFIKTDVRKPIDIKGFSVSTDSWIFNFAAIHREPGHHSHEYFETNVNGAININDFAEKLNIKNIFFTSSIAPYGKSIELKKETSLLEPETPYGISKSMAELIHQKWLSPGNNRRLIIVRPSVIYGPGDPGNIYRMIKAVKNGSFIIPGKGNIIKAYGYIYGLIDSIQFTMDQNEKFILYNYTENNLLTLREMIVKIKIFLNINKPTISLPIPILASVASFIQIMSKLTGRKSDIHPVRVRKAGFPTRIDPDYLKNNKFEFKYEFEKSLEHWKKISPKDFEF